MKYRHIFFDLDHTLWDFETNSRETLYDLYHELQLSTMGIPVFDDFHQTYHHHNNIFWDRFRKGYISREELRWKRMWRTLLDYKIADEPLSRRMAERYLEILPTKKNLFEDTLDILNFLKDKGYSMHLITNGFEKTQWQKIRISGLEGYFEHVITSEAAGIMKPHLEIFEYAFKITGATAQTSVMIGDTLDADIEGGNKAGMDTIYFNPNLQTSDIKGDVVPTFSISSLKEIKNLV
ncbi:MAG: YjjG family noncanonical pyrimidine nucleotidase [Chitinophagaceae bacterium]